MTGASSAGAGARAIRVRDLALVVAICFAYVGAAEAGFALAFTTKQVTAIWPPTGIAVTALLWFGPRACLGVFLGALLANVTRSESLLTAVGVALGNTLGPFVAAWLLQRVAGFDSALERTRDVFALVLVAFASMTVTAGNGVVQLALAGIVPWSAFGSVWRVWWIGDAMGVLVFAPLLLIWRRELALLRWREHAIEQLAFVAVLLLVCYLAFSGVLLRPSARIEYAVFPLLIWAGLRFRPATSIAAVLVVTGFALWGAIHRRGPFASGTLDEELMLLDLFVAMVVLTSMALAAITAERARAREQLLRAHAELDARVHERTAALEAANHGLSQANRELSQRTRELAAKNEEVEAFVYIVSHDLRAPLVNLQGFSSELEFSCTDLEGMLKDPAAAAGADLTPRVAPILDGIRDALKYIKASTTKFHRLIDALLLLSRLGRQEYRLEQVDVEAVVATTLDSLKQLIERDHVAIRVGRLPKAKGDTTAIGQVFANLIGNALKYQMPGRKGEIQIEGQIDGAHSHYWIRDNGAGIPASAQRRLFQVFQRFHPELASGDGMGLAIVKRVVERHDGRVWVESTEQVGSTFHLTLSTGDLDGRRATSHDCHGG